MIYNIGIDLGGTNIAAGLVDEEGLLIKTFSRKTMPMESAKVILNDIAETVEELLRSAQIGLAEIDSVGIGVPGTANMDTGFIEDINNLNLENTEIVSYFEERFRKKIFFENDANAAAWGEYIAGAGKNQQLESMLMVTLGTGIGGGIIIGGKIFRGYNFGAAEFGHMVIHKNGKQCTCGRKGCFEAYASATALNELCREKMQTDKDTLIWDLCGQDLKVINGKMIFDALRKGDRVADEVMLEYESDLSTGIVNLVNIFQPDLLCIGGGVSQSGDILIPLLQASVSKEIYTKSAKKQTRIEAAKLYNDAGIIGAALLNKQNMQ